MAIRNIREQNEAVLYKKSKEVTEITDRIRELIDDMLETLYEADGVGLAAPQVGVLKRIVVIDAGEDYMDGPLIMINPKILETDGEQEGYEGCLSVPGKSGLVKRPNYVKAEYMDEELNVHQVEGEALLARAICHEVDHLDGKLYVDLVIGDLVDNSELVAAAEESEEE